MAALGLSVIIEQSPLLFSIVKWAGAVYVAYIGFQMLVQKSTLDFHAAKTGGQTTKDSRIFRDAMVTNLLNPKVALFFIAFLPQFVQPSHAGTFLPFLLLGLTFAFLGMLWCLVLATFAATISAKLRADSRLSSLLNKICGTALLGLSISIAFAKK
jgi:threonine/homoserine/homoserine lactone efflux protein